MSAPMKIAMVGCGNVGRAFLSLMSERDPKGRICRFSTVATRSLGIIELGDLTAKECLSSLSKKRRKEKADCADILSHLKEGKYDVLVESTDADYEDAEPATSYISAALRRGKDVVTCNKGPIALNLRALEKVSIKAHSRLRFESTVMDGTPIFSLFREAMPDAEVTSIRGILNSTCNIVLDHLKTGGRIEDGVREAQERGIAESDPSKDLAGLDSAAKLVILANVIGRKNMKIGDVKRQALTQASYEKVNSKSKLGSLVRQVSTADLARKSCTVRLELVGPDDFLHGCRGSSNAVCFSLPDFEEIVLAERDPAPRETAFGLYSDLLSLRR